MTLIEEILIRGAISSGMFALLALGFTLIYGVTRLVNMAHGALFMLGTYIFWFLTETDFRGLPYEPIGLDLGLALILTVILTGIVGVILYRLIMHPVIDDMLAVLTATVGLLIIMQELLFIEFGARRWRIVPLMEGYTAIWGVKVFNSQLLAFAVSLCLFAGLWIFIAKIKIGKAMRAVAQDREVAMLMGVNVERVYMLTMGISAAFAAIAGVLIISSTTGLADPYIWDRPLYISFAIVILGGLGSIKGALLGGFIMGFAENAFMYILIEFGGGGIEFLRGVISLTTMVVVLLLRPKGLFGKRIEMEE